MRVLERERGGHGDTESHCEARQRGGVRPQATERRSPRRLRGGKDPPRSGASGRGEAQPTPGLGPPVSGSERTAFCCFKPPVCGRLLRQPQGLVLSPPARKPPPPGRPPLSQHPHVLTGCCGGDSGGRLTDRDVRGGKPSRPERLTLPEGAPGPPPPRRGLTPSLGVDDESPGLVAAPAEHHAHGLPVQPVHVDGVGGLARPEQRPAVHVDAEIVRLPVRALVRAGRGQNGRL